MHIKISNIGTPPLIDAEDLRLNEKGTYYCSTPGCTATMYTRDLSKTCAYFVSDNKNAHINPRLCLKKDNFKPDQYDENLFDCDNLFYRMLNPVERDSIIGNGAGQAGQNTRLPNIRLKWLCEMCLQFRQRGTYNGYNIDDILVDEENYVLYRLGIEVCCTFYKFHNDDHTIIMNYQNIGQSHVKIHVADDEMFVKCKNKLIDMTHRNVVVIGGYWKAAAENNILAECEIVSVGKQICNA